MDIVYNCNMKTLFFILLITTNAYSQEWKESVILLNGTKVKKGDTILINRDRSLTDIYPSIETSQEYYDRYKLYLLSNMPGKKFVVKSLGRVKSDTGYTATAKIEYYNPQMNRLNAAEYTIMLENALLTNQITLYPTN